MPCVISGTPHSREKENIQKMTQPWMKNASHAIGERTTVRSVNARGTRCARFCACTSRRCSRVIADHSGESDTTSAATSAKMSPSAPSETNATVQPRAPSSARKGTAERNWPSWPSAPVSCVYSGVFFGGNQ